MDAAFDMSLHSDAERLSVVPMEERRNELPQEDENNVVGMMLNLSGPLQLQEFGRYSSVFLHPTQDKAVSFHEDAMGYKMKYSVFPVNRRDGLNIVTPAISYSNGEVGKHPSIALVCTEDRRTHVVVTHRAHFSKTIYYKLGIETNDQIAWHQNNHPLTSGVKPKISASQNGTVAIIFEEAFSYNNIIRFHIGTLQRDGQEIRWKLYDREIPDFIGVEPNIAINNTTVVAICRTSFKTLQTKVGALRNDGSNIEWGATETLTATGINPSVAINTHGYIAEIHQTKFSRQLCRNCGWIRFRDKRISWMKESTFTTGEYPTVSINDNNYVFEMHKTNYGVKLFYSEGSLSVTLREDD